MVTGCGYMATYGKRLDSFLKEVFYQHTNNRQLYGCYISLFVLTAKKSKVIIIDYKNTFKKSIDRKWKLLYELSNDKFQFINWWPRCRVSMFGFSVVVSERDSWLNAGVPWFLTRERERERDLYHQSRQVIAYTSHRLGTGGSGEHDPKGCLPFSKLICNDFNISLVFAFGLFGDLWVVNQWDINIRNTRGIELWTSARRMYLKRSTNTLSL